MNNCSRCGASNPETNKFCGSCGQPLVAVAPPPSASPSEELPEWLRSTDEPPSTAVSSTNAGNTAPSELPAWLSDIGVEDNQTQSAPAPDWLAQLQQSPSPSPTTESDNDLPEWLREDAPTEQSADNGAVAPAWPSVSGGYSATTDDSTDALPPWLQSNDAAPVTSSSAPDDLSEWMRSDVADAAPSQATASNELPPWLQSDDSPAAPQAAANVADTVPNWLQDAQPKQSAQPVTHVSSDLPSWLDPADFNETQPATTAAQTGSMDELPAWLRDDDVATQSAATSNNDSVNPLGAAAGDELPSWMQADETRPSSAAQQVDNDLPSWLADASETPAPAQPAVLAAPEPDSLPPWLLDESASDASGSQEHHAAIYDTASSDVPSWLADAPSNDASASDVEVPVPNWASEFGEAPSAAAPNQIGLQDSEGLPSWLNDDSPSAQPPAAQNSGEADGLPAWLIEESPISGAATTTTQPFAPVNSQTPSSDELPPWLSDDSAGFAPASDRQANAHTGELPSWLSDSASAAGSTTPPTPNADDPGMTQELPSWLLDQPVDTSSAPVASGSDATHDALPAWLQTADEPINAQAATGQAASADAATHDALPPWLQTADEPTPPSSEELPPWLGLPDEPASAQPTSQVYDSGTSDGLPAWLSGDEPTASENTAHIYDGVEASTSPAAGTSINNNGVDLPSWLNEADATTAPANSASDLPPWLSGMPDQPSAQTNSGTTLPSWLDEPEQTGTEKADAGQSGLLGGLDLPAWLRDESAPRPAAPTPEIAPNWLQRATSEAEENTVPVVVEDVPPRPRVVRTPERVAAANMLQQLIAEPAAEPIPQAVKRRRSPVLTIVLALIALVIIGALLAILLNGRFGLNFGAAPVTSPMVATAAQTIAGLPSNRPVVLAYEWDAQRLGDLRPLEEVVVGQLATRTDVPLIFVSTDPQGALLATERTIQIGSLNDNFHDQYGLGYVHLGFKAGGPLALRRFAANSAFGSLFAQDVNGIDLRANDVTMTSMCGGATSDSCSWNNVSLLVVMADDASDVRGWFEQVRSEHPELQTLLLTSAEIGPEVQPYAATPNVSMLAGLRDAEMYAQVIGSPSERIGRQADATAVGGALFAAAVVVGGIPAVVSGRRARRIDGDDRVR